MQAIADQPVMNIPAEADRRRIISLCSAAAVGGWIVAEVLNELLLGPHIRFLRTLSMGSGIGVYVGLLTSTLQWLVLRKYVPNAGLWILASTTGYTLAAMFGSALLYQAIQNTEQYTSILPLQGVASSGVSGLVLSVVQWFVLRRWVDPKLGWRNWMLPLTLGNALAPPVAWLAGSGVLGLLGRTFGLGAWPVILGVGYLAAGVAGGIVYGRFFGWGLRRVLPTPRSPVT